MKNLKIDSLKYNKYLRIGVIFLFLCSIYPTQDKIENQKNILVNKTREDKELKEYNIEIKAISNYIQVKNISVTPDEALDYAITIIRTSDRFDRVDPFVLTGLIESESTFKKNVIHKSSDLGVIGMTGIASTIWGQELKEQGIINNISELHNPHKAILACGYILDKYSENKSTLEALTDYKGRCPLGKRQALDVLKKSQDVRHYKQKFINS